MTDSKRFKRWKGAKRPQEGEAGELLDSAQTLPLHRVPTGFYSDISGEDITEITPAHNLPDAHVDAEELNLLRIRSGSFALELEGDADFINAAYDAVRRDILQRLTKTVTGQLKRQPTSPSQPVIDASSVTLEHLEAGGYIWVYVCHELYRKIHVVSRTSLMESPLSKVIHPDALNKIFIDRSKMPELRELIDTSKTLWSELTSEGRRRLTTRKQS